MTFAKNFMKTYFIYDSIYGYFDGTSFIDDQHVLVQSKRDGMFQVSSFYVSFKTRENIFETRVVSGSTNPICTIIESCLRLSQNYHHDSYEIFWVNSPLASILK